MHIIKNIQLTIRPALRLCFSSLRIGDRVGALLVNNFLEVTIPNWTPYEQPSHSQFCFTWSCVLHAQSCNHPCAQAIEIPQAAPADDKAHRYAASFVPNW